MHAEEISFSIYSIPFFGSKPDLVSEGKKIYQTTEVKVVKGPSTDEENWKKSLPLAAGFELGVSVYRQHQLDGFGMWIRKDGSGFSWEWFDRESADTYRKLQGRGRLKVRFIRNESFEEVAEIKFLTDVTMRLNTLWFIPFRSKDTDEVVIKEGSVLLLSP